MICQKARQVGGRELPACGASDLLCDHCDRDEKRTAFCFRLVSAPLYAQDVPTDRCRDSRRQAGRARERDPDDDRHHPAADRRALPVHSIADVLRLASSIDVRARGERGVADRLRPSRGDLRPDAHAGRWRAAERCTVRASQRRHPGAARSRSSESRFCTAPALLCSEPTPLAAPSTSSRVASRASSPRVEGGSFGLVCGPGAG